MGWYIADIRFQSSVLLKVREQVDSPSVLLLPMSTLGREHLWPCEAGACSHEPGQVVDQFRLWLSSEIPANTSVFIFLGHRYPRS